MEEQKRERRVASIFGFMRVVSNFRLARENEKRKSSWTGLVQVLLLGQRREFWRNFPKKKKKKKI